MILSIGKCNVAWNEGKASEASSAKNLKIHIRSWSILAQAEISGPVEIHYFWNAMQSEAHSK